MIRKRWWPEQWGEYLMRKVVVLQEAVALDSSDLGVPGGLSGGAEALVEKGCSGPPIL